ncbi:MAG: hypothetical protein MZV64_43175 [Ignavibacteriales bacterium]|nr:hypothetical protein [Ignavibacteriales bacterium]
MATTDLGESPLMHGRNLKDLLAPAHRADGAPRQGRPAHRPGLHGADGRAHAGADRPP